jgi:hypothetical protein
MEFVVIRPGNANERLGPFANDWLVAVGDGDSVRYWVDSSLPSVLLSEPEEPAAKVCTCDHLPAGRAHAVGCPSFKGTVPVEAAPARKLPRPPQMVGGPEPARSALCALCAPGSICTHGPAVREPWWFDDDLLLSDVG